jgi:hypothetical protein
MRVPSFREFWDAWEDLGMNALKKSEITCLVIARYY